MISSAFDSAQTFRTSSFLTLHFDRDACILIIAAEVISQVRNYGIFFFNSMKNYHTTNR